MCRRPPAPVHAIVERVARQDRSTTPVTVKARAERTGRFDRLVGVPRSLWAGQCSTAAGAVGGKLERIGHQHRRIRASRAS